MVRKETENIAFKDCGLCFLNYERADGKEIVYEASGTTVVCS